MILKPWETTDMKTVKLIFSLIILWTRTLDDLTRPRDHTLVDCRSDFTVTRDLTETREIKRDLRRKTNRGQLTLSAGSPGAHSVSQWKTKYSTSITADDFATFFTDKTRTISNQFSPPHTQDLQPTTSTAQTPIFSFCPLTEAEVSKLLLSSHPTTCPLDPIPSHLLQAISPTLLPALTHIINTSLRTGIFPTAFKQARVTPLPKKPALNTSLLENYRPVSLLPFVAKTLERVVFNQLSLFLSQYNKLDAKQSGFRSGHSTETALLSVTEALRIAKADCKSSVLILLDLSAAFDTVNHQILLSTLSSLGITGIPLRWFESYLTGRSFRVACGGEVSKAHQLVTGVPQGSVLGPLLFSTYTTSLGPIIQANGFSYHCYADDTQLYLSFQPDDPTVAARISGCLADISAWMKEHHLQLNLAKTELLVVPATPTLQHDFSIQLGTSIITPSTSVRNLGVIFDDQLTFKEHIAKTARSCRFALHNIRKIRPFLTEHAAQLLVQALVVSRLDYCNALLSMDFHQTQSNLYKWFRMQRHDWSSTSPK